MSNPNDNENAAEQEADDIELPNPGIENDEALDNAVFAAAYQSDESLSDALDNAGEVELEVDAAAQSDDNYEDVDGDGEGEGEGDGEGDGEAAAEDEDDDNAEDAADAENANTEEDPAADRRSATKKELTQIIDKWEQEQTQSGYDPVPTLRR